MCTTPIFSQPNAPTHYDVLSPTQQINNVKTIIPPGPREHCRQQKIAQHQHIKQTLWRLRKSDDLFLDNSITQAKDERTAIAKNYTNNAKRMAIDSAHAQRDQPTIGLAQCGQNMAYRLGFAFNQTIKKLNKNKHVSLAKQNKVHLFNSTSTPSIMLTYNSGVDGHYISEHGQCKAGLPILRPSTQQVGVTNRGTSNAKYVTQLLFQNLSAQSRQADTFQDFPTSLMSMGKTSDDSMVLVFTKESGNIFWEEDVLITCKGEPILIGNQDNQGQYQIPLMQQQGHWQPRCPSKQTWKALRHANSVYDLPSTKQAIKWVQAICGYPIKLTWLKAIKVGNYVGWPMLKECNFQNYYPETIKIAKGHLNLTRKNIRPPKLRQHH